MKKITFECEIITPMFIYGGDGEKLELRPSEFKGMLRFWWRALHPNLSLGELKSKEAEIFGNTERKSSFRIKVKLLSKERKDKNINLRKSYKGINYLFYSIFLGENKDKEYFQPNTKFETTFIFYKEKYVKDVLNAFWLLTYLGGLGSRNRRGAGSFRIIDVRNSDNIIKKTNLNFIVNNEYVFKKELAKILPKNSNLETYINLGNFSLYEYEKFFETWAIALKEVGNDLLNFRDRREPDYSTVKDFILNGATGEVLRPAFGLPLEFRYRSLENELGKKKNSAKLEGSNKERQRSGSPLFIKILKFNRGYKPILIFFKKKLLPQGGKIKISSKNQPENKLLDVPDYSIINQFLDKLMKEGKIQEVQLNGN